MKKFVATGIALLFLGSGFLYFLKSGLLETELASPDGPPVVQQVPDDWENEKLIRASAIKDHIFKHSENYEHFANFPVSKTDGIPLIFLKLLPKLAPEFWGQDDEFLSVIGLFNDERLKGFPLPRGMGFTGMVRSDENGSIDKASFSCGACHIGRVRLNENRIMYLDGGINTQFNVIGYRSRIVQTLAKLYQGEEDPESRTDLVVNALLQKLDTVHEENPNFFYNNYQLDDRKFDKDYEANQVLLFKKNIYQIVSESIAHQHDVYDGWLVIADKFYPEIKDRISSGFGGMEDAIAFNAASAYQALNRGSISKIFAPLVLPQSHGLTDIMVVWDQDKRDPRWDEKNERLINGGGQWNGHIPLPIYKNIAAQVTIGFDDIDVSVSAHAERLLQFLPAPAYPFDIDVDLARRGQNLFEDNCLVCHRSNNGKVYDNIGTDLGRAKITGTLTTIAAQGAFTSSKVCSPETVVELAGEKVKPCSEYRGVSLLNNSRQAMLPPRVHDGYNALPLSGLWAQAPFLHNGSVPTLFHMLVPSQRPKDFVKGLLDYDKKLVGYKWTAENPSENNEGYIYDVTVSPATSNIGHDRDIFEDGKIRKLNWDDDIDGAMALIEYLKTL